MRCDATDEKKKGDGGFDESEMKSSRHWDKEGGIREVSIVHNVTRDHEKKVEPAAESNRL